MGSDISLSTVPPHTPYHIGHKIALADGKMRAYHLTLEQSQLIDGNSSIDIYDWMNSHAIELRENGVDLIIYGDKYYGYFYPVNYDKLLISYVNTRRKDICTILPAGTVIQTHQREPYIYPLSEDTVVMAQKLIPADIFSCIEAIFSMPTISRKDVDIQGILFGDYVVELSRQIIPIVPKPFTIYSYYHNSVWYSYPQPERHMDLQYHRKISHIYVPYVLSKSIRIPSSRSIYSLMIPTSYGDILIYTFRNRTI